MDLDQTLNMVKGFKKTEPKEDSSSFAKILIVIFDNISKTINKSLKDVGTTVNSIKSNIFKTQVTNFPIIQKVEVVGGISNQPPKVEFNKFKADLEPIVKGLESVKNVIQSQPQTKEELNCIVRKLEEIKTQLKTESKKEIKNDIVVQNPISTTKLEKLILDLIQSVENIPAPTINAPTLPKKFDIVGMKDLIGAIAYLQEIVENQKQGPVVVANPGDFPVSTPIPTFRDSNNQITQAKVNSDREVIVENIDTLVDSFATLATEDKQDDIITELDNIQDKQDDIIEELQDIESAVTDGYVGTTANLASEVTLTTANVAYLLPTIELSDRRILSIYNKSDYDVFVGGADVTVDNGMLVEPGDKYFQDSQSGVYAVCATAGVKINIVESK